MEAEEKKNYWQQGSAEEPKDPETPEVEDAEEPEAPQDAPTEDVSAEEEQDDEPAIDDNPVSWTASEYIHVEKNALWYVLFLLVVVGLIALGLFVLKSYTFAALVLVMSVALVIYGLRPPRTIQYTLSTHQGLYIGEKLYKFDDFKAFGLIQDGVHHSIMLQPTKRFAPGVSVYFPEEAGEEIVDILGAHLPMKKFELDLIDVLVRQLRL